MSQHVSRGSTRGRFSRFWKKRKRPSKKFLSYVGVVLLALFFAGSIGAIGLFAWVAKDLPNPDKVNFRNVPQTTRIFDRTGKHVLYEVHGDEKRTVVDLSAISPYVKNATVAVEDKDFYRHNGFDMRGILRALYTDIVKGGKRQGGSTITQQFIKKSILSDEKTLTRKVKELILAIEIERRFTKDQILKLYLNEIPYGSLSFGIESASQTYFGKSAKDLTLPESVLIVALPQAPSRYSPYGTHTDELVARTNRILDAMVEQGYIAADEASEAKKNGALAHVQPRKEAINAPHFVFFVKDQLATLFGDQEVEGGGLRVITTLDVDKQKIAEDAIAENRESNKKKWAANTAAMTAFDPKTGEVLAMVGSADYFDDTIRGKFNSMLGLLQPGSSIKPMVYAAAFEKGYTPNTVVYDVTTTFKNYPKDYTPNDYDMQQRGPVTLKQSLAGSLNIPAVQVLYLTGIDRFIEFAKRFGYTSFNDRSRIGLALTLGGGEVHPIEHIAAFSAFAREGLLSPTTAILRVEDRDGKVLIDNEKDRPSPKRVVNEEVVRQVNSILTDNAARAFIFGERNFLTLGNRPVAAKTGTTNDYNDAWAIGYTPSLVAGVWVGNADGKEMKKGADGSKVAAPIWNMFMKKSLEGTPVEQFTAPAPVLTGKPVLDGDKSARVKLNVDKVSGKLATASTPPEYIEERAYGVPHSILYFVDKDDPRGPQPAHPESDPQFANWEKAVADWAVAQNIVGSSPPTEFDDVHTPENVPTVYFSRPSDGETVPGRSMYIEVGAQARRGVYRVEFSMDGDYIGMFSSSPFSGFMTVPNRFVKGFHTLTAKAFDDVGNSAKTTTTVNLTADPGPLDIQWKAPWSLQELSLSRDFPFHVSFSIGDTKSLSAIQVVAHSTTDDSVALLGRIDNPVLPNFSMEWKNATLGRTRIVIEATLRGGETRTQDITVDIIQ